MNSQTESIIKTEYAEIMQKSYIDYAMSVIIARALPDVRDGLKPVQRRTLYDMLELGIRYDKPYRKCARIVGDTMGKYHPHGDSSIYDALVVMAQDFKKGKVLVDGHGNFGSIEGDGAAAMRYTEARLSKFAQEVFLEDLDKNVVNFVPNFDENEKEPAVLPVRIPNLLVNGTEGIAVGMAASIPTHNLGEVTDAVMAYMKNNDITTKQLMKYIKGPDFPTGGIVTNQDELLSVYECGQGRIRIRGKVEFEKGKGGRDKLVISEIPYTMIGSGIGKFLNDVAALIENKKTSDILDISNQSSKEGIRIVLEIKKGADPDNLANLLYSKTRLEDTFGVNFLAVSDGRPEVMGLKTIIEHHVEYRFELCTRKYTTLLNKERERQEIQEGLIRACDVIDLIIEILRGSKNIDDARDCLIHGKTDSIRFKSSVSKKMAAMLRFTERQAKAILEMRLYKLIGLEIEALMKEHEATMKNIAEYEDILNNYDSMANVILSDLASIKKEFDSPRRTVIENKEGAVFEEKGIEEQEIVFSMDKFGYMRSIDKGVYERNQEAADKEARWLFTCMNTGRICIFTDTGRMHAVKMSDIPMCRLRDKGTPVDNISNYDSKEESIIFVCSMEQLNSGKMVFTTQNGLIKQIDSSELNTGRYTIAATKLNQGDKLVSVDISPENGQVIMETGNGYFLRFQLGEIPLQKKNAAGVRGIRLGKDDKVIRIYVLSEGTGHIEIDDENVVISRFRLAGRDGKGSKLRLGGGTNS